MKIGNVTLVSIALTLGIVLVGCGDDDNPVPTPAAVDPSGNWRLTEDKIEDACGLCAECEFPWIDDLKIVKLDEGSLTIESESWCEPEILDVAFDSTRNAFVYSRREVDTWIDAIDGCEYRDTFDVEVAFAQSSITGWTRAVIERLSGVDCAFPARCEFETAMSGVRCEDCWDGCVAASAAPTREPGGLRSKILGGHSLGRRR